MRIYKKYYYLKYLKPTSPGKRFQKKKNLILSFKENLLFKFKFRKKKFSGRNNTGKTTVWNKGGKYKKSFFYNIDFFHQNNNLHMLSRIEHLNNFTSLVGLFLSYNGTCSYRLLPNPIHIGQNIITHQLYFFFLKLNLLNKYNFNVFGDTMPLFYYGKGIKIHNLQQSINKKSIFLRSAGTKGKLLHKFINGSVLIKFKTNEYRHLNGGVKATVGETSNHWHFTEMIGKAGRNRYIYKRPVVRGTAMNPIDHPHGGGQGKSKGGNIPMTPWGKVTKGKKTSSKINKYQSIKKYIL